MEIFDIIKTRRSIRSFQARAIPKEVLEKIIDAARFAPTARAIEPWEFIVVTRPGALDKIAALAENGRFIKDAAACIAIFCKDTKYYLEDGCAATENILLAATALGIGSCWVAGDKKPYCNAVGSLLGVPDSFKLISLIALGYPHEADSFKVASKRQLSELIHWEKF